MEHSTSAMSRRNRPVHEASKLARYPTRSSRRDFFKLAGTTLGAALGLALLPKAAQATDSREPDGLPTADRRQPAMSIQYTCCQDPNTCGGGCPPDYVRYYCRTATPVCSDFCTACQYGPSHGNCYIVHYAGC